MANLDTAAKRISGVNVGSPWRGLGYFPTGTVDAAERLALAYLYSGVAAVAPIAVPDVDDPGTTQAAATASIQGVGLVVAVVTAYSNTVPAGEVISQNPAAGTLVAPGSTVTITVSLGDAPVPPVDTQTSGGWWPDYEHVRRQREKRRREIEEAEAEEERIADATSREIYRLERELERKEADRADLDRLQKLADTYVGKVADDVPKPIAVAIWNAQDARTRNALEQLRRMVDQQLEDELMAVQQIVLLMLTD